MTTWIIPNKAKDYDVRMGMATYGDEIEWTKKRATTNIAAEDVAYLYESAPVKAVTMKFVVIDSNVTAAHQSHDNDGTVIGDRWFRLKFLENIEPIAYDTLLRLGIVNGYIQAARKLNSDQEYELENYIAQNRSPLIRKIQSNGNVTDDEIADEVADLDGLDDITKMLKALETNIPPGRVRRIVKLVVRNKRVSVLAKQAKGYICEICGREPFLKKDGQPYAEADHIQPLGGNYNGLDSPDNIRCLCAQCHRVVTYGSEAVIEELLSTTKWRS